MTALARSILTDRRYLWDRSRLDSIRWSLRPRYRVAHYTSAVAAIYNAANGLLYPYGFTQRERRDMVRSYLDNAITYIGMAVGR